MKESPILFSGEMVKAILEGRKTQTRRFVKGDLRKIFSGLRKPPYGQVGDRLWVREAFAIESNWNLESTGDYPLPFNDGRPAKTTSCPEYGEYWEQCHYRATDPEPELSYDDMEDPGCRWKPSIHMPRWASRINLEITAKRWEWLQDISKADCIAEGMLGLEEVHAGWHQSYAEVWDKINVKLPKDAADKSWDANPMILVVTFKKI